jgi:hypothetical protein
LWIPFVIPLFYRFEIAPHFFDELNKFGVAVFVFISPFGVFVAGQGSSFRDIFSA